MLSDEFVLSQSAAAKLLGVIGDEQSVPLLIQSMNSSYVPTQRNSIYSLGIIGDSRAVIPIISSSFTPQLTFQSIIALGRLDDNRAVPRLLELANTLTYQEEAINSLGMISSVDSTKALISIFDNDHLFSKKSVYLITALKSKRNPDSEVFLEKVSHLIHEKQPRGSSEEFLKVKLMKLL